MPLSLMLLAGGFLLVVTGAALLALKVRRVVAVACLIVGLVLIALPPVLVVITSM